MVVYLEKIMERLNSGEKKIIFRTILCILYFDLMKSGRVSCQEEEETRTYFTDSSGEILYLRALQGHSGRNLVDPSLQDNVLILDGFFKYIYHVGCAINLHSIINSRLIPGGQNLSNRQTVFFLPVDPMDKNHKDLDTIDLEAPCLARYMHTAWKKHQNTVYWVDIKLAQKKGLKFYQTRSNDIILHNTFPAYCIPKAVRMETEEIMYEKVYESPRPPPKISFRNDWMKELGSEVVRQAEDNQPIQPNPSPIYRTWRPVVTKQTSRSSAQEIDTCFSLENSQQTQPKTKNPIVRTGRPVSTEQPSGSLTQEIDKRFLLGCESTNERTGCDLFKIVCQCLLNV